MTDDRVIAFDMNASRVATASAAGSLRPAPAARTPRPRHANRAMNRAQLASVFAGLLGAELAAADLLEHIQLSAGASGGKLGLGEMAAALKAMGLVVRVLPRKTLSADGWPALAEMANGQVVLVLGLGDTGPELYDPTTQDKRAEVPMAEFMRVYAGRILHARTTMAELESRHVDGKPAPHWFWGEFRHYKRQYVEAAAGSLFANLLAVAVALFSLQIYDRVIPYQSEPTLWVLALGVLLAVMLEGSLKVARATLMDNTGRKIELAVQARLMRRLLGLKAEPGTSRPSEVFAAMRDFGSVREFFTSTTVGTLADLPFLIVFLALVASIGGNLVWVLVLGGILMVAPGFLMQKRMMAITASTQGASTRAARLLYESVFEHETITTQRGEDRVKRIWAELVTLSAAKSSEQRRLTSILSSWAQGIQQATYVSAVVVGTYMVFAGQFTVGTIIAIGILTGRTLGPLAQVSSMMARWSQVKAALTALEAVANARQAEEQGRKYLRRERIVGAFELRHVEFAVPGGHCAAPPAWALARCARTASFGPSTASRPFCRISVRVVNCRIGTRCVAMIAVRPCNQPLSRLTSVVSSVWSSAAVGSSRSTTCGSCSQSRAQPIDWRWPTESPSPNSRISRSSPRGWLRTNCPRPAKSSASSSRSSSRSS